MLAKVITALFIFAIVALAQADSCQPNPTSSEPIKIIVPLYFYPGSEWDTVIAYASKVNILAIINPDSGPVVPVDSSYKTYMSKMKAAGIELIGYVHTSYGNRSLSDVENDINDYATYYPLLDGIFVDEAAIDASALTYYAKVFSYIKSKNLVHAVLNPGEQPDQGYLNVSTSIVIFENYGSDIASTSFSSWVTCAPSSSGQLDYKYKFTGIAHNTAASIEATYVGELVNKGTGYVYATDGAGGCCTYNSLTSYFPQLVAAVAALN